MLITYNLKYCLCGIVCGAAFFGAMQAFSLGQSGHMLVGQIAYEQVDEVNDTFPEIVNDLNAKYHRRVITIEHKRNIPPGLNKRKLKEVTGKLKEVTEEVVAEKGKNVFEKKIMQWSDWLTTEMNKE